MILQIPKGGALYFALVFGAGLCLASSAYCGSSPNVGTRIAELLEAPFMLVITIVSARWIVLGLAIPSRSSARLEMGAIALGLLLFAEFGLVFWLRGISIKEYLATETRCREKSISHVMPGLFGIMPLFVTGNEPAF